MLFITITLAAIAFGSLTFLWGYYLGWDGAMEDMKPLKDSRAAR